MAEAYRQSCRKDGDCHKLDAELGQEAIRKGCKNEEQDELG